MSQSIFGAKPLESFCSPVPSVRTALRKEFGKGAAAIIAKIKAGQSLPAEELGAHDIISDLVQNNSVAAELLAGWSSASNDTFPINIMQFGSVFWIGAPEFDDIGYFGTLKEAKNACRKRETPDRRV